MTSPPPRTRCRRRCWPAAGLAALDALADDSRLAGHHRLPAARAHLHELAGDRQRAIIDYRAAAARTSSLPEQRYLMMRAARLAAESVELPCRHSPGRLDVTPTGRPGGDIGRH